MSQILEMDHFQLSNCLGLSRSRAGSWSHRRICASFLGGQSQCFPLRLSVSRSLVIPRPSATISKHQRIFRIGGQGIKSCLLTVCLNRSVARFPTQIFPILLRIPKKMLRGRTFWVSPQLEPNTPMLCPITPRMRPVLSTLPFLVLSPTEGSSNITGMHGDQ